MSHHATNWAIAQRGIKPALKVVLWHLADCHNPAYGGTFPSQEYLAERCEIPRSTLNGYLDQLESAGLIARERRRKKGSSRQERTRYYFPFEARFTQFCSADPSPESGHGYDEAVSRNGQKPSPEIDESRVQNLDSNPVREPVRESVKEKHAPEDDFDPVSEYADAEDNSKSLERRVKVLEMGRHGNPWPGALSKSTQWAVTQFEKLSPEDRDLAEERRDDYLKACNGKPVALGVYLRDRKFLDVVPKRAFEGASDGSVPAPFFGPVWGAARVVAFLRGSRRIELPENIRDTVRQSFEKLGRSQRYANGKGLTIADDGSLIFPADFEVQEMQRRRITEGFPEVNRLHDFSKGPASIDARYGRLKPFCEFVPLGCDVWEDWRRWHDDNAFPWLPDAGAMKGAWFPAGGPGKIYEFEQHANEVFHG